MVWYQIILNYLLSEGLRYLVFVSSSCDYNDLKHEQEDDLLCHMITTFRSNYTNQ